MMRTELIRYIEDTWDKLRGEGQSTMLKVEGAEAPIFLRANDAEVSFLLALPIEHGIDLKPKKYSNVTIAIEKLSPETKGIVVALTNRRFLDTFVKIAADVIGNTMGLRTTSEQSSIYGTKVNSWKNIFSRSPATSEWRLKAPTNRTSLLKFQISANLTQPGLPNCTYTTIHLLNQTEVPQHFQLR